jgi:hypothetical protein
VIHNVPFEEYTELHVPEITFTTSSQVPIEGRTEDDSKTPEFTYTTTSQMRPNETPDPGTKTPEFTYTTTSQRPVHEMSNIGRDKPPLVQPTASQRPGILPPRPVINPPPRFSAPKTAGFTPVMNLGDPTQQVANAAFQAGAEGANIAENGMGMGMGQFGQVMAMGMKQQAEAATMGVFKDMANLIAKEVRNVSKGVKDVAGG